ncbi:ABC transporter permease subunit [Faecalicatena orotica]|uniref:ABC-2 type transport system permease protein n=1 Tax=Faecalicatena orotica TaxID=1544 RepID=A0A2Y9BBX7_9FIRM|nr:ABC transporter permease [Faecalicatena orotica]PWJ30944.1 ABC-2 type transport system permease protein [Faecalicatena orotica]SSA55106.1 ABC-2 type transport system permease protein [Faecalicatena orotica]
MKICTRKLMTVTEMKTKALFDKNVILIPVMVLGITVIMKLVYSAMLDGKEIPPMLLGVILNLGLTMNITMTGTVVTSTLLAQEKEKHTLRTLMTSSVSGVEFFLGSMIPPLAEIMLVNIILIPLSGISFAAINLGMYVLATLLASLTSCILGMLVGIFARSQMSAGTLTTPLILVFMLVPTFASIVPSIQKVSRFLYTGVIAEMASAYASGKTFHMSALHMIVLAGEILLAFLLFLLCYKKNGYEKE